MALIRADSLEWGVCFFNRMGKEEVETRTSNFSFQVLLNTHPEKLGGIRPFKINTSFILLRVR